MADFSCFQRDMDMRREANTEIPTLHLAQYLKLLSVFTEVGNSLDLFFSSARSHKNVKVITVSLSATREFVFTLELRFAQIFNPNRGERISLPSLYSMFFTSNSSKAYNYLFMSKRKVYIIS